MTECPQNAAVRLFAVKRLCGRRVHVARSASGRRRYPPPQRSPFCRSLACCRDPGSARGGLLVCEWIRLPLRGEAPRSGDEVDTHKASAFADHSVCTEHLIRLRLHYGTFSSRRRLFSAEFEKHPLQNSSSDALHLTRSKSRIQSNRL